MTFVAPGAREEVDEEVTISHGRSPRSQLAQEQHEAEEEEGEGHAEGSELSTGERLAELRARHDQLHGSANVIGGQSNTVKLRWGAHDPDEMNVEGAAPGIKFALGENPRRANGRGNRREEEPTGDEGEEDGEGRGAGVGDRGGDGGFRGGELHCAWYVPCGRDVCGMNCGEER